MYQKHLNIGNISVASNTKSLYRSRMGSHFYGTENEIQAGFGLLGNTEKFGAKLDCLTMLQD